MHDGAMSEAVKLLAQNVRTLLATRPDLEKRDLAVAADVSPSWVTDLVQGTGNPTLEKIEKVGAKLGVPAWSLIHPEGVAQVRSLHTTAHNGTGGEQKISDSETFAGAKRDRKRAASSLGDSPHVETRVLDWLETVCARLGKDLYDIRLSLHEEQARLRAADAKARRTRGTAARRVGDHRKARG